MNQREICRHEVYKFVNTKYMGIHTPFLTGVISLLDNDIISNICNLVMFNIFGKRIKKIYFYSFHHSLMTSDCHRLMIETS